MDLDIFFFILSMLCVLWAIAGLVVPKALFFAKAAKKTRLNAMLFPLCCAMAFVSASICLSSASPTNTGIQAMAVCFLLASMWYAFKLVKDESARVEKPNRKVTSEAPTAIKTKKHIVKENEEEQGWHTHEESIIDYTDEMTMEELRALADALGIKKRKNKADMEDAIVDFDYDCKYEGKKDVALKKAKELGILDNIKKREEDLDDKDFEPNWKEALEDFLGRPAKRAEDAALRKLFGERTSICCDNIYLFISKTERGRRCFCPPSGKSYSAEYGLLIKTGVILYGKDIPLADRLGALPMDELRALADSIGAARATSKDGLAANILSQEENSIFAAMRTLGHDNKELFLFDKTHVMGLLQKELGGE